MRNGKKWLAVATALCMAVPSMTVFADQSTGVTGSGSLEYDSKEIKDFYKVVLPTITDSTYGFTLDPTGILNSYDSVNYPGSTSVYFTTTGTPATLSNKEDGTNTDQKLYVVEYKVVQGASGDATSAEIKTLLTTAGGTGATEAAGVTAWNPAKTYCVWGPVADELPLGEYVELTLANVNKYCTVTDNSGTMEVNFREDNNVLDTDKPVFDKVLYEKVYTDISTLASYDALDYVTVDASGAVTGLKENGEKLYVASTATPPVYTEVTASNYSTYLEYTKAVPAYLGTSDTVKIVNKSNKQQTVTAKVTVTNPDGLNFVAAPLTGGETVTTADINMTLSYTVDGGNATNKVVANTAASGDPAVYGLEFTVDLDGADDPDTDYNVYKGGLNPATQGHKYERYIKSDMTYSEAEFSFTATIATNAQAEPAWKAYAKSLEDAYKADGVAKVPSIDVVYKITGGEALPEVAVTGAWATDGLWFSLDGNAIDLAKIVAVSVMQADGSYADANTSIFVVDPNSTSYAKVTWQDLVDAGSDGTNVEFKVTYEGKVYVVTPAP